MLVRKLIEIEIIKDNETETAAPLIPIRFI